MCTIYIKPIDKFYFVVKTEMLKGRNVYNCKINCKHILPGGFDVAVVF